MNGNPAIVYYPKRMLFRLLHSWRQPHAIIARVSREGIKVFSHVHGAESCYADSFDLIERAIMNRLILPGSTVLDVGANIGLFTCLFARKVGGDGRVIAFEPTSSTFQMLKENVSRNGLQDRVELHCVAVSDRQGETLFNVFPQEGCVYNSLGVTDAYGLNSVEQTSVKTVCLDEIIGEETAKKVSFIKIDVEGWEYKTVIGGSSFLKSAPNAVVMIELNERASRLCGHSVAETLKFMDQLGYGAYRILPPGKLSRLKDAECHDLIQNTFLYQNIFFAKAPMVSVLKEQGIL